MRLSDFRGEPLLARKERLQALLRKPLAGLHYVKHIEADGEAVFRQACALGLEGIISKLGTAAYPEGPTTQWLKVKNPSYGRGFST